MQAGALLHQPPAESMLRRGSGMGVVPESKWLTSDSVVFWSARGGYIIVSPHGPSHEFVLGFGSHPMGLGIKKNGPDGIEERDRIPPRLMRLAVCTAPKQTCFVSSYYYLVRRQL